MSMVHFAGSRHWGQREGDTNMADMRKMSVVVALAGIIGVAGCGGGDGDNGGVVSCTLGEQTPIGTLMVCEEASGLDAAMADQFRMSCMLPAGADAGVAVDVNFAHAPCPRAGALGGCRVQSGGATVIAWYYDIGSTNTFTSSEIQQLCSSAGATFVSP
jgi:hypothetical protein